MERPTEKNARIRKPIGPPNEPVPCSCCWCSLRSLLCECRSRRIERAVRKERWERAVSIDRREEA